MAREGLMDDCGYDFEPTEAEERARDEGYEQAMADAHDEFRKECSDCIFVFRKDKVEEIKKQVWEKEQKE